jgi:hypothetical protein
MQSIKKNNFIQIKDLQWIIKDYFLLDNTDNEHEIIFSQTEEYFKYIK